MNSTRVQRAPVVRTSTVKSGLRISMVLPTIAPLPRSALLPVRVQVTNVTHSALSLPRPCDRANPRAVVTNSTGIVEYTTIRTWPVSQRCVRRSALTLSPGHSVERRVYVVLRGDVVQPVVDVSVMGVVKRVAGKGYALGVQSRYRAPTAAALFTDGSRKPIAGGRGGVPLFKTRRIGGIAVTSRAPVVGPLVAVESALCPGRRVLVSHWTVISRTHPSARIPAPCPRPRLWLVDYGWAGESMGQILVGVGTLRPSAQ